MALLMLLPVTLPVPVLRELLVSERFGVSELLTSLFMSINMVGAVLAAPLAGPLADRFGRRPRWIAAGAGAGRALLPRPHARRPRFPCSSTIRFVEGASAHSSRCRCSSGSPRARGPQAQRGPGDGRDRLGAAARRRERRAARRPARGTRIRWCRSTSERRWVGAGRRCSRCCCCARRRVARANGPASARSRGFVRASPIVAIPLLFAFADRFTVGFFTSTFPLYAAQPPRAATGAHRPPDRRVHAALRRALVSRSGSSRRRLSRAFVLCGGSFVYGCLVASLGFWPSGALVGVMLDDGRRRRGDVRAVDAVHGRRDARVGAHHLDGRLQRRRQPRLHRRDRSPAASVSQTVPRASRDGRPATPRPSPWPAASRSCSRSAPSSRSGVSNEEHERSDTRILTTHAGSLPRPAALTALLARRAAASPWTRPARARRGGGDASAPSRSSSPAGSTSATTASSRARASSPTCSDRLTGFGGQSAAAVMRDIVHYPSFLALKLPEFPRDMVSLLRAPQAVGEVRYVDAAPLAARVARLPRAHWRPAPARFAESFRTAAVARASSRPPCRTPTTTRYEDYVDAVADALRTEYEDIARAGFVLQVDAPTSRWSATRSSPTARSASSSPSSSASSTALNRALADVPRERVRLHVCWGNYEGPHIFDVALEEILPHLYRGARRRRSSSRWPTRATRTSTAARAPAAARRTGCSSPA